jgi:hypothetical protein
LALSNQISLARRKFPALASFEKPGESFLDYREIDLVGDQPIDPGDGPEDEAEEDPHPMMGYGPGDHAGEDGA